MGELPLPTQIMMSISTFLVNFWPFIILAAVLIVAAVTALLRQPGPREKWDHFKLRAPVFGKLLKIICTARFARTLSALYVSGIPMLNTLQIAKTTVGNKYIENQFDEVINALGNGQTLSVSLALVDGFEQKLISTILIGEESGRLEDMLGSVAEQYDYDAEMATQRLVSLMEPIMIVVMAGVVLMVIVSVLLPIFQMYSNLGASG
jgi:type IV pilus assembly protein PilC